MKVAVFGIDMNGKQFCKMFATMFEAGKFTKEAKLNGCFNLTYKFA